ncbi:MAG: hypothetical protein ABSH01_22120 [Terriglobia bacterium]|jgi:hypothetical protein
MAPDYDLSNLETSQVDLWMYLQVDAIRAEILADQAECLGFPLALGDGIVSVVTEKPQAIFKNGKRGADRWGRLRKQN